MKDSHYKPWSFTEVWLDFALTMCFFEFFTSRKCQPCKNNPVLRFGIHMTQNSDILDLEFLKDVIFSRRNFLKSMNCSRLGKVWCFHKCLFFRYFAKRPMPKKYLTHAHWYSESNTDVNTYIYIITPGRCWKYDSGIPILDHCWGRNTSEELD